MRGGFIAVAAAFAALATVVAGPAAADPAAPGTGDATPPPVAEPGPPPISGIGTALGQSGGPPAGPFGLPDLSAYTGNLMLGQNPVPAAPGEAAEAAPAAIPNLSAFNPDYLLQQNLTPAAPGEGTPAPGIGADGDIPGTGRIAFLRRIYEMYQAGALKGALLGQQSPEEFAQQDGDVTPPSPAG